MNIAKDQVVLELKKMVGDDQVNTELSVLQENSHDRHLKFQAIHNVFPCPLPICVCKAGSTEQVSRILKFCNEHGVRVVPYNGGSATDGGLQDVEY